ncbi:MAG: hypothetical protein LBQ43_00705 [Holosporales bacterium]|nr:hypothetical protein [Holosporales bacterium]
MSNFLPFLSLVALSFQVYTACATDRRLHHHDDANSHHNRAASSKQHLRRARIDPGTTLPSPLVGDFASMQIVDESKRRAHIFEVIRLLLEPIHSGYANSSVACHLFDMEPFLLEQIIKNAEEAATTLEGKALDAEATAGSVLDGRDGGAAVVLDAAEPTSNAVAKILERNPVIAAITNAVNLLTSPTFIEHCGYLWESVSPKGPTSDYLIKLIKLQYIFQYGMKNIDEWLHPFFLELSNSEQDIKYIDGLSAKLDYLSEPPVSAGNTASEYEYRPSTEFHNHSERGYYSPQASLANESGPARIDFLKKLDSARTDFLENFNKDQVASILMQIALHNINDEKYSSFLLSQASRRGNRWASCAYELANSTNVYHLVHHTDYLRHSLEGNFPTAAEWSLDNYFSKEAGAFQLDSERNRQLWVEETINYITGCLYNSISDSLLYGIPFDLRILPLLGSYFSQVEFQRNAIDIYLISAHYGNMRSLCNIISYALPPERRGPFLQVLHECEGHSNATHSRKIFNFLTSIGFFSEGKHIPVYDAPSQEELTITQSCPVLDLTDLSGIRIEGFKKAASCATPRMERYSSARINLTARFLPEKWRENESNLVEFIHEHIMAHVETWTHIVGWAGKRTTGPMAAGERTAGLMTSGE